MVGLPNVGSDAGVWGTELNNFLNVAHNSDGTLQTVPVASGGTNATTAATARKNLGAGFNVFHAVVDYGAATGNTSAANTTALQNCLTAAAAAKGTAYIPAGTYHISSALTGASFTRIQGDSFYGTTITQDSANTDTLQLMGADSSHLILGCEVRDITLAGPGIGSGSTGICLNLNWCDDTNVFSRLFCTASGSHGCKMQNSYVTAFRDCWFAYNGGDGFFGLTAINSVTFSDCEFGWNTGNGCTLNGVAGVIMTGCDIESNGLHGMNLSNIYTMSIMGNDFENNGTSSAGTVYAAIYVAGTSIYSGPGIRNNNFTGTGAVTAYGIKLDASVTQAYMQGNSFNNFALWDILIVSGASGVVIGTNNVHEAGSGGFISDSGTATAYLGVKADGFVPADLGWKAWTYDPNTATMTGTLSTQYTAGVVYLSRINVRYPITMSTIQVAWIKAVGGSPANSFFGLYNSSGTRLGVSSDVTATSQGILALNIGSNTLLPGYFYVGYVCGTQGSTSNGGPGYASLSGQSSFSSGFQAGAGLSASQYRGASQLTGQTSLPSSLTLSSNALAIYSFWAALY